MTTNDTSDDGSWPTYPVSSHEYAHAIGILCVNYNNLEANLLDFLLHLSNAPANITAFSFARLGNEARLDLLKKILAENAYNASFIDHVIHFSKGFKLCAENRNIILHSQVSAASTDQVTIARKRSKSGKDSVYYFTLEVVRQVADETFEWSRFGHLTICHALYLERSGDKNWPEDWTILGPRRLPEKPKLPESVGTSGPSKMHNS